MVLISGMLQDTALLETTRIVRAVLEEVQAACGTVPWIPVAVGGTVT